MSIIDKNGLKISSTLFEFINKEVIPGTDIKSNDFVFCMDPHFLNKFDRGQTILWNFPVKFIKFDQAHSEKKSFEVKGRPLLLRYQIEPHL